MPSQQNTSLSDKASQSHNLHLLLPGWLSAQQRIQHWDSDSDLTLESTVSMHLSLGAKQECQENDPINRETSKSTILV